MAVVCLYQHPALSVGRTRQILCCLQQQKTQAVVTSLQTEYCYYVQLKIGCDKLNADQQSQLFWLLNPGFGSSVFTEPKLSDREPNTILIEIGPRLNFSTPFSTNAVSICHAVGLTSVVRIERSIQYLISFQPLADCYLSAEDTKQICDVLHDRMTECRYLEPVSSFDMKVTPHPWTEVNVLEKGQKALEETNQELGLGFDDWDLNHYTSLFRDHMKRNPTTVECFDLAQSNSEHSRHWFFKGQLVINGHMIEKSLIDTVMETQLSSNDNNIIKFSDNSSAILGYEVTELFPSDTTESSVFQTRSEKQHIIFTAETHNFPTGVAPFSGAATGTGGRIRDVHAAGRGAHVIAGTASYCFGNLNIPGYKLPWEDETFEYPRNFALPVEIIVEASNGASDYGNKFGEPVLLGFARSFGMKLPDGHRREWVKPIMFSGGIGSINEKCVQKLVAEKGMTVVKIGGPVYRIGVGGGAASSIHVQGDQKAELDFGAVQRGDAEMEQKLNRVIRACIERHEKNPILSIHDQGAGGNGNVLKEIVEPAGAIIHVSQFQLGDPTINTLELWGAEYQESDAILINNREQKILVKIGCREKCPVSFVGEVTGDGRIVLSETSCDNKVGRQPVDLDLELVLGKMPRKVYHDKKMTLLCHPLTLPENLTVRLGLERVLRLPSVASKRYLTNKVDRSVTGLVAQQQCVGPLHTPLADVAVVALSYFDLVGGATSIGEQPIKGLINPAVGARMSVTEAVTNLMFARITSLQDVKCSANWMWAAKLPGEGAALYEACQAMCETMSTLGIAVDGGKDSLSMAARLGSETIKAPGSIVISAYAPCPDITATVTPDLKCPDGCGYLVYINLSGRKSRLGGTALAQCFNQLGEEVADLESPQMLRDGFSVTQDLIKDAMLTAGHDISDGGLITCLLEMAFAGNCGIKVDIKNISLSPVSFLFGEEAGWIIETRRSDLSHVLEAYQSKGIPCVVVGQSQGFGPATEVSFSVNGIKIFQDKMTLLRDIWEETSFQLELRQTNPDCVNQEKTGLATRTCPPYKKTFEPVQRTPYEILSKPQVAVIREEGTNGDREMVAALHMVGFDVWDVTMTDLLRGDISLNKFRGLVFPGGFSFADVLGSAKGWAGSLIFHKELNSQFTAFYSRHDTFSLGICNGCQLMAWLGWICPTKDENEKTIGGTLLTHNLSERFESRFVTVRIEESSSIMLKGMEGSVLGVWVAHGEGRFIFKEDSISADIEANNLVAVRYVDDYGQPTTQYPLNPNGSERGIAGLCSHDGRHLAMMPHPERCIFPWQWAWMPEDWRNIKVSPWLRMFQNAFDWCVDNSIF
ncbi:phosphoribosylformylglycinamidine synthase-like isoform X1 [Limulus polyphemus]|uniref:phosphoribosylformylglycinamidine synthase n=2 Tax=Limulus polyphemus TaxID=6850 RepID=A0ABM1SGP9_LIMPO|nr:phosphoribosylformylglycinamidine synthase-like isoform X1 [Limulus polyphemus]XP_022242801.1 phosphoribosylformylglycinamidine synthase-like isoform X1 [Limulus polyphemus]XP_022242802.1 phosphoribosylformylglycinamidine synthase-like isoform X1 [Limulus polyphemus]XP_022242803.1 phosphoribosylformylglycinamidine synthase-like isoform X1 [Limulus polyphemus]XP_022242804.1 phosphoribosylformylglycinamidine synthase-like isoform X1 [Limulus polyphemus]